MDSQKLIGLNWQDWKCSNPGLVWTQQVIHFISSLRVYSVIRLLWSTRPQNTLITRLWRSDRQCCFSQVTSAAEKTLSYLWTVSIWTLRSVGQSYNKQHLDRNGLKSQLWRRNKRDQPVSQLMLKGPFSTDVEAVRLRENVWVLILTYINTLWSKQISSWVSV